LSADGPEQTPFPSYTAGWNADGIFVPTQDADGARVPTHGPTWIPEPGMLVQHWRTARQGVVEQVDRTTQYMQITFEIREWRRIGAFQASEKLSADGPEHTPFPSRAPGNADCILVPTQDVDGARVPTHGPTWIPEPGMLVEHWRTARQGVVQQVDLTTQYMQITFERCGTCKWRRIGAFQVSEKSEKREAEEREAEEPAAVRYLTRVYNRDSEFPSALTVRDPLVSEFLGR